MEFLNHADFTIETFPTGELCLDYLQHNYFLDGIDIKTMDGIRKLDKSKAFNPDIPVVMLSSQNKIEVAVECMHYQAFDYVVKSETVFYVCKESLQLFFIIRK